MRIANIITVTHDNSVTRLVVVADAAAELVQGVLKTLGHDVELGLGDVPERDRYELERLNGLLEDVHAYLSQGGINIPKPPKL